MNERAITARVERCPYFNPRRGGTADLEDFVNITVRPGWKMEDEEFNRMGHQAGYGDHLHLQEFINVLTREKENWENWSRQSNDAGYPIITGRIKAINSIITDLKRELGPTVIARIKTLEELLEELAELERVIWEWGSGDTDTNTNSISEAVLQLVNNEGTIKISELLSLVGEFIAVLEGGKEGEYDDNNPQNRAKAILCIKRAIAQASLKSESKINRQRLGGMLTKVMDAIVAKKAKEETRAPEVRSQDSESDSGVRSRSLLRTPQESDSGLWDSSGGTGTKVAAAAAALGVGGAAALLYQLMQKATSADPDPTKQESAAAVPVYPDLFQPAEPQTLDDPGGPIQLSSALRSDQTTPHHSAADGNLDVQTTTSVDLEEEQEEGPGIPILSTRPDESRPQETTSADDGQTSNKPTKQAAAMAVYPDDVSLRSDQTTPHHGAAADGGSPISSLDGTMSVDSDGNMGPLPSTKADQTEAEKPDGNTLGIEGGGWWKRPDFVQPEQSNKPTKQEAAMTVYPDDIFQPAGSLTLDDNPVQSRRSPIQLSSVNAATPHQRSATQDQLKRRHHGATADETMAKRPKPPGGGWKRPESVHLQGNIGSPIPSLDGASNQTTSGIHSPPGASLQSTKADQTKAEKPDSNTLGGADNLQKPTPPGGGGNNPIPSTRPDESRRQNALKTPDTPDTASLQSTKAAKTKAEKPDSNILGIGDDSRKRKPTEQEVGGGGGPMRSTRPDETRPQEALEGNTVHGSSLQSANSPDQTEASNNQKPESIYTLGIDGTPERSLDHETLG